MLRVGKSKLKALAVAAAVATPAIAMAQSGTWTFAGSQTWSIPANWANGTIADGAANTAFLPATSFGTLATAIDINLNGPRTIGRIDFADNGGSFSGAKAYNITGASNLTMNAGSTINTDSGTHMIRSPLIVNGSNALVKTGGGTLVLTADNDFNSNAIAVNGGVLVAAGFNSLDEATAVATSNGGVLELGMVGAGTNNLSPGNLGTKIIGLGSSGAPGGTIRNVNGANTMGGIWFVLASGSANVVGGSLTLTGSIFDSDVGTLNGFTKAGTGTFTANSLAITGNLNQTAGQFNLVGTGSSSVGNGTIGASSVANITGGHLNQTNGTLTVVNPVNVGGGGYTLAGPGRLVGNAALTTGTYNQSGGAIVDGNVTVGGGTATFNGARINGTLAVNGGTAKMTVQGTANNANGVLRVQELAIASGQALDITNNSLIVDYSGASPLQTIRQKVQAGFNGGNWNGTGILTSLGSGTIGIGYAEASDKFNATFPGNFAGQVVADEAILVKYTFFGDADIDGDVDNSDLGRFLNGFGTAANGNWFIGDFDYDGDVDNSDLGRFLTGFGNTGLSAPLELIALAESAGLGAMVPEPGSMALLGIAGMAFIGRRRRKA